MPHLYEKHPLATRWLHWVNFPLLALMIWSGLLIYWANPIYHLRLFGRDWFHFFPPGFFAALGVPQRLSEGIALHFFWAWLFVLNGAAYFIYTLLSGAWRSLVPVRGSWRRAVLVTLHDLHLTKKAPPQGKYNDAQRIAYSSVFVLAAGSIFTGLAIYKPLQLAWLTNLLGGYEWARWEHFWLTLGFVAFFLVHVAQVIRAGWSNFASMVTGCELVQAEPPPKAVTVHPPRVP